jgi:predicted transcriptional regulator of viral defense system
MGPGGQRLRDIRSRSGAAIDVGDPIANGQRIVTIRGARPQVEMAKEMLREVASHGY